MAIETVEISVYTDDVVPVLLDDVVVRVFDEAGATFITSGMTGDVEAGRVQFSLNGEAAPAPTRYQLRFFIEGGSIPSPQYIDVYSPPEDAPTGANNFEITASVAALPNAVDPRLCRASGYIKGPDGRPKRGIDAHFIPCFNPLVVGGVGILGERVAARTDKDGYISIDLYRNAKYLATVESHENIQREVSVPDRSSVNISHLLFPVVVAIEFDVVGPWEIDSGESLEVVPTVTTSAFVELEAPAAEDVQYTVADRSVATVEISTGKLIIYGHAVGTTTLTVSRKDASIIYIPDTGIDGGTVTINVV